MGSELQPNILSGNLPGHLFDFRGVPMSDHAVRSNRL